MGQTVSKRIVDALHLRLSPELQTWFDGGWNDHAGEFLYNEVCDPEEVIEGEGSHIWGGAMPPDNDLYLAGWDRYYSNDMTELLEPLAKAAKNAGSSTLEELALLHLRS